LNIRLYKLIPLFYLVTLAIFSCQKDTNQNTTITNNDSTTLIKAIDFDTTKVPGLDTMVVYQYDYDNLKRLFHSKVMLYSIGSPYKYFNTTHYYNGNDILPFKEVETISSIFLNEVYTRYCSYLNNKIIYDSIILNNQPLQARRYSYETDKLISLSTTYSLTLPPKVELRNIYFTKVNGNTILQRDTTTSGYISNFLFSYDNKNNPYAGMVYSPLIERSAPHYVDATYIDDLVYERNNATEITQSGSYNFHFKYSYEYYTNGFPAIAKAYWQSPTGISSFTFKRIFIYTKL
jgi:hypothetical protein